MSEQTTGYRLLTRSDFDGLVCAILLKERGMLREIKFVHPKDVQDGKVEVTPEDILTNLPYVPGCHLCFDHHASEAIRNGEARPNHILDPQADSAARVVYRHYGGPAGFPGIDPEILRAVDKADSARFTRDEILNPRGWALLSFLMDARTGLGRFRDFRISNYQLMMHLIDHCRHLPIEQILELPDVRDRVELYLSHQGRFVEQIHNCATVHGNVVVLDLRGEETIYAGNRFMIYALYPGCNVSMHVLWGVKRQNTVFAMGKSILNRTSRCHIGELALRHGGGGHAAAGTCQIDNDRAEDVLPQLIAALRDDDTADLLVGAAAGECGDGHTTRG